MHYYRLCLWTLWHNIREYCNVIEKWLHLRDFYLLATFLTSANEFVIKVYFWIIYAWFIDNQIVYIILAGYQAWLYTRIFAYAHEATVFPLLVCISVKTMPEFVHKMWQAAILWLFSEVKIKWIKIFPPISILLPDRKIHILKEPWRISSC